MYNFRPGIRFSVLQLCYGAVGTLLVAYIGIIAVIVSYATMTVEFSQSVRNDEAAVATLESKYITDITRVTSTDYIAAGYAKPLIQTFVSVQSTALR